MVKIAKAPSPRTDNIWERVIEDTRRRDAVKGLLALDDCGLEGLSEVAESAEDSAIKAYAMDELQKELRLRKVENFFKKKST